MTLPYLSPAATLSRVYADYLSALEQSAFCGDIDASYAGRMMAATDNSVYQLLPQAVIYPKSRQDIVLAMQLAQQSAYRAVRFSPRGGGTGTNGQSLNDGIVIDLSRHMNQVLEVNAEQGWVRVQAGVVKDQLNDALRPYGYFFSPDLSTSNRATIGGMINTDASGQGSLVYGKTSDHVLALRTVLLGGEVLDSAPVALAEAEQLSQQAGRIGQVYQQTLATCVALRDQIKAKFPPLNRFLTGYDLLHAYDEAQQQIDVSRLIAGSEGTLGFVCEAKLNITPIPKAKVLVNVKYDNFQSALKNAPFLVEARATSVETIDSNVLNLARQDIIWSSVEEYIQDVAEHTMNGINMVEFTGVDEDEINDKLQRLLSLLDERIQQHPEQGIIGYQVCREAASIQAIYAMRKKAVGLLGATKGRRKPVAFAEDTAVPPEKLADFIGEFRALLDAEQLHYGMFGHVDAGVLHVRPALDMTNPDDEKLLRKISDQVAKLTAKYGGLMWGEHGKGFRSEYSPSFFGDQLYQELCKIKASFDPDNRLNPGKIATAYGSEQTLVSVDARKRGYYDRQIPVQTQSHYQAAMDCNGNGLCFNYDADAAMCPSYKVTRDRRYSPKGRATLIREWLRLTHAADYDASQTPNTRAWWRAASVDSSDFNHQVKQSMDACLACKACAGQCPVKVDVPSFRARFLAHYHSRYKRPLKDYLVASIERSGQWLAKAPRLSNLFTHNPLSRWLLKRLVGYQDAPRLSTPTVTQRWRWLRAEASELHTLKAESDKPLVVIVQDPFTSFYDAEVVQQAGQVLAGLGWQPLLLNFSGNGKAQHVKGFLDDFTDTAKRVSAQLRQVAACDLPMIGLDASTTLLYRDEYRQFLTAEESAFQVQTISEFLFEQLQQGRLLWPSTTSQRDSRQYRLLPHCTEQTAIPAALKQWQQLFAAAGLKLVGENVGCCGMAGTYGHEVDNQANSRALFDMSWAEKVSTAEQDSLLATGFSCRCQVKRYSDTRARHPLSVLAQALQSESAANRP